jgi:type II restriction/modification system DNA methylase subunit YeeA
MNLQQEKAMNKTAIKNFAIWARRKLISDITYKSGTIGINEKSILQPLPISTNNVQFFDIGTGKPTEISNHEIEQRNALIKRIKEKESTSDYKTAFQFVIEEVAYTWFNRLIAIRFMEVNDYLPSRIRVLSSETKGKSEPDMVTTPFDTDMDFSPYEKDRIMQLKDENKLDELFRMLFIKQCNKLNEVLPELFEKTLDYTEFLLNISFTDKDGLVSHLVNDIDEEDFKEAVEIIGWLYQYYNTEPKEEVFALLKKNVKITKERIPAATQLFTPDWIVRYMVENSLGRLWIERERATSEVSDEYLNGSYFGWKYYLEEAEQEEEVKIELKKIRDEYKKLNLEDIKVMDPCMGSGHILVYVFDVLMQIYESQGYTKQDAVISIIENNLYGLDIDDRAYQLAYFAVMMRARKYDRRFLTKGISPRLYSIQESNNIKKSYLKYFGFSLSEMERNMAVQQMEYLLDVYLDAKEYGSILNVDVCDWELLNKFVDDYSAEGQMSLESLDAQQSQDKLKELISIAETMAQKYDVVVTNPPYMGGSGMSGKLSDFLKSNYPTTKTDLFAAFIEKGNRMTKYSGYNCMVTMQSWMFLSSFQKMREDILNTKVISNLLHMENMVMGIAFGTAVANLRNIRARGYKGTYNQIRLCDIENEKPKHFPEQGNRFAQVSTENFCKIPGSPIAYWASEKIVMMFENYTSLGKLSVVRNGMKTGDNGRFLRLWWEVANFKCNFNAKNTDNAVISNAKWFPYNKGGEFRKWYGNNDYIINWENKGTEIFEYAKVDGRNVQDYPDELKFSPSASWSLITSGQPAFRYKENNLSDIAGMSFYTTKEKVLYYLAFCNTPISLEVLQILAPTINFQAGDIGRLPIIENNDIAKNVVSITETNISISKADWDSFENSWDFQIHPLIKFRMSGAYAWGNAKPICKISSAFKAWEIYAEGQFAKLKANEEKLNHIFIEIYGLQDELTPEVEDKDVTVRKADLQRDIKSFISYAVGCMFGRYSLDVDGLAYAGGEWDDRKYTIFIPDNDNVIPITDEEYFKDDIVGLFVSFVKRVYGNETLEENLDFIATALSNKGDTSREVIRNYFLKDFFKDHIKIYQKRPIYWLYDSGKQDGFKALMYMHRYNADTTGIVRVDYLHKMQKIYMNEIDRMQDMIENSTQTREIAQAEKRKEKLIKQLKETKKYDEKIAHIALSRIEIDLDDGVKVNYEKAQIGQEGKKLSILAKI